MPVAFDIFLQAFRDGDAADTDVELILSVVDPCIRRRDQWCVRIETNDGGADVYGLDTSVRSLMISHASGREVWDLIYDMAQSAGMTVMPTGCPACVTDEDVLRDLPLELAASAIVVSSADELLLLVNRASYPLEVSVRVSPVQQDSADDQCSNGVATEQQAVLHSAEGNGELLGGIGRRLDIE